MNTANRSDRLILAEHAYRRYCLDIPAGVTFAELLAPEYWRLNTDGQLRPNDIVRVRSETEGFDCELIVKAILPGAGVIVKLDVAAVPGTPERKWLEAIEVSVRAEEAKQAEIEAAIGGKP